MSGPVTAAGRAAPVGVLDALVLLLALSAGLGAYRYAWPVLAWVLSRRPVARRLVGRAMRTPYQHITSADGSDVYMLRWWLFNPYHDTPGLRRFAWCPFSIRLHHIRRADQDRDMHDHPWNARTVILRGYYIETRENGLAVKRSQGDTATLRFGEFHRIDYVPPGGVATLFITWRYQGTWGFKVDGRKVPYRDYLEGRR